MKLGILTALWQRPAISTVVLDYYADPGLMPGGVRAVLVAANSEGSGVTAGAPWHEVFAPNEPLSDKWLAGITAMREHEPDAVMIVGSDDLVSGGYIRDAVRQIEAGAELVLLDGLRVYCMDTGRGAMIWPARMGAGRMVTRQVLDRIDWKLWPSGLGRRLDGGMDRQLYAGVKPRTVMLRSGEDRACLDIKSAANMWTFDQVLVGGRSVKISAAGAFQGFEREAERLGITTTGTMAKKAKHLGGGWYELPSGEKVKGKAAAEKAMSTPEPAPEGTVEVEALVNIPATMGGGQRIPRGQTFSAPADRVDGWRKMRYVK